MDERRRSSRETFELNAVVCGASRDIPCETYVLDMSTEGIALSLDKGCESFHVGELVSIQLQSNKEFDAADNIVQAKIVRSLQNTIAAEFRGV